MSGAAPLLPHSPVKLALVSGEYPRLAEALKRRGIASIETVPDPRLPRPTASHPDMQVCFLPEGPYVLRQSPLRDKLASWGLEAEETGALPQKEYPGDVLCNGFVWGGFLVATPKTLDARIQAAARRQGLEALPVRQGYASCAVARIDGKAAVTADKGMARRLTSCGFDVLCIQPGFIDLPGYDTGFFGGCCGKIAPDVLAVSGRLDSHPDGGRIRAFIESRGVAVWELTPDRLVDVGGILPLA